MKPKFRDILDLIAQEELLKIKKDIEEHDGVHLKALIDSKLNLAGSKKTISVNARSESVCSTCLGAVSPFAASNYTLLFGPEDFKKQANFCSIGCMSSFMKNTEKSNGFSKEFSGSLRLG